jgi:glycosyltransferase involved in cell wall biosynthesis
MTMPKVSIITIVWNDAKGLEKTIQSVIHQTYENIEYIIIDGGSTDATVDIIKKYKNKIDYWVSEKDKGIYDAMNKGIQAATGTWVNFMNAGDTFVDNEVLEKINFESFKNDILVYGKKLQNNKIINPLPIKVLEVGEIHANHQSMFFNKYLLENELKYDLQYKIYADYELVNKIYLKYPKQNVFIDQLIADFEGGGVSSVPSVQKRKDKYKIVFKYYGFLGLIKAIYYRLFIGSKNA